MTPVRPTLRLLVETKAERAVLRAISAVTLVETKVDLPRRNTVRAARSTNLCR
jgi:hypothetical protein